MRNAHEAIRKALDELKGKVEQQDVEGFKALWANLKRAIQVHMKMEEEGFFQVLDEV